ncbi:MAG: hypothetical protein HS113_03695 [Verrucomicrobiales bacterium]|nr:hypothetical protein [Verrucomicrobiales bacterium]
MLPDKERNANLGVGIGLGFQIAAGFLGDPEAPISGVGCLIALGSLPLFVWGCVNYAEGKGHNKWVGLVGLVGLIGLVILLILPDLRKNGRAQLADAMRLERAGHVSLALAEYAAIRERFAGTDVAQDAEASLRIARTRVGLGDGSRTEPHSPRCREGTGADGFSAPQVTAHVRGGAARNVERLEYAQTVRTPARGIQLRS